MLQYTNFTEVTLRNFNKKYMIIEQQFYIDSQGDRYNVDGKYVVLEPTKREKEVANLQLILIKNNEIIKIYKRG